MDVRDHVWAAIIAGGQGTRLFPISYTNCPKQFCRLDDQNTFIQATIKNYVGLGIKPTQIVMTVTSDNQMKLAKEQALPRGVLSQNIYRVDPDCGYVGSMAKATEFIFRLDPDAIIVNTPADHYLLPDEEFSKAVNSAIEEARQSSSVILGIKVNDIVTATGCGHALFEETDSPCFPVIGFVEKPDILQADEIMRQGNSACNTGIIVWKAERIISKFNPDDMVGLGTDELMYKLDNLKIVVGNFEWHDCGTLKSLYDISKKTPDHKNASLGKGSFEPIDCHRSLLYASEGMELRVTGAEDLAIIFTTINEKPIIVIAKLDESQSIKSLAEDYSKHEAFLTADFSFGARNNIILRSNISDELIVGFVGVQNYAVYVHKNRDGTLEAAVSQQLIG